MTLFLSGSPKAEWACPFEEEELFGQQMSASAQPEPFVDADAVAAFLCLERRQVLEMARRGIISAHPLMGQGKGARNTWRLRLSEVAEAIASGTRKLPSSHENGVLAQRFTPRTMPVGSPRSQRRKSNG